MCYNRPQRYSSRLVGHQLFFYFHELLGRFCYNCQHINVSYWHCTYKKFDKCTPTATKHALHANFIYVHEKVIFLGRSRLRALDVLVFAHGMQKQGCLLIRHTANKRLVKIEACCNCPRSPLPKCNTFGGHKFPSEATAKNAWIKSLGEPEKRKLGCRWQFHAVGPRSSGCLTPPEWVPYLFEYICNIWLRSDGHVERKGGTDTPTAGKNGYRITYMAVAPPSG